MKTRKELLILLLGRIIVESSRRDEYTDKGFIFSGMCCAAYDLYKEDNSISYEEEEKLSDFIKDNRPKRGKLFDPDHTGAFWYKECDPKPRIAWCKHHIKRLSK